MVKKIVKLVLVVMMLVGIFIAVANTFQSDLHSEFKVTTYYKDIPDCDGPAKDCNDFTSPKPN